MHRKKIRQQPDLGPKHFAICQISVSQKTTVKIIIQNHLTLSQTSPCFYVSAV